MDWNISKKRLQHLLVCLFTNSLIHNNISDSNFYSTKTYGKTLHQIQLPVHTDGSKEKPTLCTAGLADEFL